MDHQTSPLLTKEEASARMRAAGVEYSPYALKLWRKTWPDGERKGPMPLLVTPRRLRYRESDVEAFIADSVRSAAIAASTASVGESGRSAGGPGREAVG